VLSKNEKYLGAVTGYIFILHTWGQTLSFHPHIHCIISGGGIDSNRHWKDIKNDFLFPVKVLSRLFRGKYLSAIREHLKDKKLFIPLSYEGNFYKTLSSLYEKEWVVYCKEPFHNPDHLINYLGRYTHRIAISNHRLLEHTDNEVTFAYKDYADGNKKKSMTLQIDEFIRRFLMHVLPYGFYKIRYYGFLCNRNRRENIRAIRLELKSKDREISITILQKSENNKLIFPVINNICPICNIGILVIIESFLPPRSPPCR
jgi:hypothetical protein